MLSPCRVPMAGNEDCDPGSKTLREGGSLCHVPALKGILSVLRGVNVVVEVSVRKYEEVSSKRSS